eukprot:1953070-Karenia_brevis.AAC.1
MLVNPGCDHPTHICCVNQGCTSVVGPPPRTAHMFSFRLAIGPGRDLGDPPLLALTPLLASFLLQCTDGGAGVHVNQGCMYATCNNCVNQGCT